MITIERLESFMRSKKLSLCVAESFTGGGISARLTAVPGSSDVVSCSLVTYSNAAKEQILGVKKQTIEDFGAVSENTVSEMLDGLEKLNLGSVFLATSGNAGPTSEKPGECGLIFVGCKFAGKKVIEKFVISGSRAHVTEEGINKAIELLAAQINM